MPIGNREIVRILSVILLFLATIALSIWLVWKLFIIIVFVLVAGVLALAGRPLTDLINSIRLGRFQFPRWLAALLTVIAFYGVIAAFIALLTPLVAEQARNLGGVNPSAVISSLEEPIADLEAYLDPFGVKAGDIKREAQQGLSRLMDMTSFSALFAGTVGFVGNLIVGLFATTFTLYFLLKNKRMITRTVLAATPDPYMAQVQRVLRNSRSLLRRYLVGILLQLTLFAIIVFTGLSIIGIKYALLIAISAALLNAVPYLGPVLGALFGLFVALTTHLYLPFYYDMIWLLLKVYAVFWLAQVLDNYVFQPNIFANVVLAHPLEIFLVVLSAGYLAGIPGMIVAIPTYTFLRIIAREFLWEFKVVQALTGSMESLDHMEEEED